MNRDTNEKITDGARGLFEKATGYVLFLLSSFLKRAQPNIICVALAKTSTASTQTRIGTNVSVFCRKQVDSKWSN
jgi:hypothetical protein